ncbi:LppU/SCO3897 family protein [Embleya sp. NPDC055664]|uniref:LppU/SCO3897 family protein n=1 Tax=Embleya sp. NPDC059237 TaxID=3346784 RepID=UPI0036D121B7
MSNPFPPGPNGPQQPNQGWNQQPGQQPPPQGGWQQQPGQPQQGWGQQPGQPGGYPPAGQPGFYGGPPPPPPRKSKLKKILIPIAVLVVLAIVGLVAKNYNKDDATTAKAGDCLGHIEGGIGKSKMPKIAKCDSPDAKWKILKKVDGSSDKSKCDGLPDNSGYFAMFYWTGSKKGVVCMAFTSKTTLADVKALDPISTMSATEEDFQATKKQLEEKGAKFE